MDSGQWTVDKGKNQNQPTAGSQGFLFFSWLHFCVGLCLFVANLFSVFFYVPLWFKLARFRGRLTHWTAVRLGL